MKFTIEDQALTEQVREYLSANGVEVPEDAPLAITLPGAQGKVPQLCESGSGLMTGGGRFAPGYDAKLKSALQNIVRGTLTKIPIELTPAGGAPIGPMNVAVEDWTPERAAEELDRLGWPQPKPKPEKKPKEPKAEGDGSVNSDGQETGQTKASRRRIKKEAEAAAAEAETEDESEAEAEEEATV
jgi:hypothetical protein